MSNPLQPPPSSKPKEESQDCLACRVVGTTVFIAAGTYTWSTGREQLIRNQAAIAKSGSMFGFRSRMFGLAATSLGLVGLGIYRWVR